MILLTSTIDLVQVVTGSTQAVQVQASYVDLSGTTVTPGRLNTSITTAATTTVVGSPAASTQRAVEFLSIQNTGTLAETVTVKHTDGTTPVQLQSLSLSAGYTLAFEKGTGWKLYDGNGNLQMGPGHGLFIKRTLLTSGTSFTTSASTATIFLRGVGGGGGGGGCTSVASSASAAGGGGSGGYLEKTIAVSPNTAYTYAIGAAGAGNSGAGGGNGGNSTFAIGATTYTAFGGVGAVVATAATTLTAYAGGAGGALSTNGDLNVGGTPGNAGHTLIVATPILASGNGGSSDLGAGGNGLTAVGAGASGTGYGTGGSGAATGASTARAGGAGTAGCWVVEEYT